MWTLIGVFLAGTIFGAAAVILALWIDYKRRPENQDVEREVRSIIDRAKR